MYLLDMSTEHVSQGEQIHLRHITQHTRTSSAINITVIIIITGTAHVV